MANSEGLDEAIEALTGENDLTLEQRIDLLGQEIIANAFYLIEKNSKRQKTTKEESAAQEEMIKRFNEIEKVYSKMLKNNRTSANNSTFDQQVLAAIKKKKSSIQGIVVTNTIQGR